MEALLDLRNPLRFLIADPDQDKDCYIKSALTNREHSTHIVLRKTNSGQLLLKRNDSTKMKKLPKTKERLNIKKINWLKKSNTPKLLISNLGSKAARLKDNNNQLPENFSKKELRNKPLLVNKGSITRLIPRNASMIGIETLKVQYKKSATSDRNLKSLIPANIDISNTILPKYILTEKRTKQDNANPQLLQLVDRFKQAIVTFRSREKLLLDAYNNLKAECAILKKRLISAQT